MILADKIMILRKKNGWSQEELAEKINVSRQSVSKWEGAQSVPDLNKILMLSRIFDVSTDFLLKDEIEEADLEGVGVSDAEISNPIRKVSMEEAKKFLELCEKTAGQFALATFLCVISPICLLFLSVGQECGYIPISEDAAGGLGMIILLFIVAGAVAIFIYGEMKLSPYEYLEKEEIDTEYGVDGMVREKQRQYKDTFTRYMIIGTCICILSLVPMFSTILFTEDDFVMVMMVCVMLFLVGVGAMFFVVGCTKWGSMQKLLQEGDYTVKKKANNYAYGAISTIYWLVVTAIFLAYGFAGAEWKMAGIIWPIAGVLYGAILAVCKLIWKES